MGSLTGTKSKKVRHLVGGFYLDGESADVIVAAGPKEADAGELWQERRTTLDELPRDLQSLADQAALETKGAIIEWVVALGGDLATHKVVEVPPSVRSFPERRLEACLRETEFGRIEAIEETGYKLGHAFDGNRCMVAIARIDDLQELVRTLPV